MSSAVEDTQDEASAVTAAVPTTMREARRRVEPRVRYDAPPTTEAEREYRHARYVTGVTLQAQKLTATRRRCGNCVSCTLPHRLCVCGVTAALPTPHAVAVLLHCEERLRPSSTHRVLMRGVANTRVYVHGLRPRGAAPDGMPPLPELAQDPDEEGYWACSGVNEVWNFMEEECRATRRMPVVLYPSAEARSTAEVYALARETGRTAGLHVLVLDATWRAAPALMHGLPSSAMLMRITPREVHTLFAPLRTQPQPHHVSSVEAVAAAFDEWTDAARAARVAAGRRSAAPLSWGMRLREHLKVTVDAMSLFHAAVGKHEASRGSGFRTWFLARRSGVFARIPAHLVCHIAAFAYGDTHVMPAGYVTRYQGDNPQWRDVEPAQAIVSVPGGHDDADAEAAAVLRDVGRHMRRTIGPVSYPPELTELYRSRQPRYLPPSSRFTRAPLWRINRDMFTLAGGGHSRMWSYVVGGIEAAPAGDVPALEEDPAESLHGSSLLSPAQMSLASSSTSGGDVVPAGDTAAECCPSAQAHSTVGTAADGSPNGTAPPA